MANEAWKSSWNEQGIRIATIWASRCQFVSGSSGFQASLTDSWSTFCRSKNLISLGIPTLILARNRGEHHENLKPSAGDDHPLVRIYFILLGETSEEKGNSWCIYNSLKNRISHPPLPSRIKKPRLGTSPLCDIRSLDQRRTVVS